MALPVQPEITTAFGMVMIVARPESQPGSLDLRQLQLARDAHAAEGRISRVMGELGCAAEEEAGGARL